MARRARKTESPSLESRLAMVRFGPLPAIAGVTVCIVLSLLVLGRIKSFVYAQPEYSGPVKVELECPGEAAWVEQEGWKPRILACLKVPQNARIMDRELLEDIGRQLNESGWVRRVHRVQRSMDGTVRVLCDYRRPVAMLRIRDGHYVAVDRDGVRLPEVYDPLPENSGWMRIVGVDSKLPEVGKAFVLGEQQDGADALAAVELAVRLFSDPRIVDRISRIDVSNFRGRRDKYDTHLTLLTREGRKIKWGSAIGEEVEEPTVGDKLRNLVALLEKGTPQAYADLSVYRNGWIEPAVSNTSEAGRSSAVR